MTRSKGYRQRGGGKKLTLKKVEKQVKKLRSANKPELKYIDMQNSNLPVNYTGITLTGLSTIAGGTDYNQRVGKTIRGKYIHIKGAVYGNSLVQVSSGYPESSLRMIIYADREPPALPSTPAASDVLQTVGSAGSVTSLYSIKNQEDLKRYKILYDKTFGANTAAGAVYFEKRISLKNLKMEYAGSVLTDFLKNQVFVIFISDVAANDPIVNYNARLYYVDE